MELFDAHMHFSPSLDEEKFNAIRAKAGITMCTLQCIAQQGVVSTVPAALAYKAKHPQGTVYVNGGLSRTLYHLYENDTEALSQGFVQQANALLAAGCDGIKMLEGKPDIRRNFPIPDFDAPVWEAFWQQMEQTKTPVTLHVNDPEEFWDESKINPYAKAEGWFYGPETINNEVQYAQIEAVLRRHPKLKLQLAHFYFFSAQLPRLAALLREFENVRIDLTPGIEMYTNMAQNIEAAKAFFVEFGSRILYGSDIGSRALIAKPLRHIDADESMARVRVIRTFLETSEPYTLVPDGKYLFRIEPTPMQGLGLDAKALAKIYGQNAKELFAGPPKPVDKAAAIALCRQEIEAIDTLQQAGLYPEADTGLLQAALQQLEGE